jgi:hypothetical protein
VSKTIDLVIKQDYLTPFGAAHNPRLCPELADYLATEAYYHPELSLEISCPAEEQERLGTAIGNTFMQRCAQLKGDMFVLRVQALSLMVMAIGLVVVATQLNIEGTISLGMVTIIAWMMVWRSAEIVLLDLRAMQRDTRKYQRIIHAPRKFI